MERLNPAERLESRHLLAAVVRFDDVDGDRVTVTTSRGSDADLQAVLTISSGQLETIKLAQNKLVFAGTDLAVTVARGPRGDGLVAIGEIAAEGIDLGRVSIKGDLGSLAAGDATVATPGVAALTVDTLGRFGLATGASSLRSRIKGPLGSLIVTRDVQEAAIIVEEGGIGGIKLGGSLIGGSSDASGSIVCTGNIGPTTVRGSLLGNAGQSSGQISSSGGGLGPTRIFGSILGGNGEGSGSVRVAGEIPSITVSGEVAGGSGKDSGRVETSTVMKSVTLAGNLKGGDGDASGAIIAGDRLGSLAIRGSIVGGAGEASGAVFAAEMPRLSVQGSVIGGSGARSGRLLGGTLAHVSIKGSIIGAGFGSGRIEAIIEIGSLDVGGNMLGGFEAESGLVSCQSGRIGKVSIKRGLFGGEKNATGLIFAADIGSISVGGNIEGGSDELSGGVVATKTLASVAVGGSLVGGSGKESGLIRAAQDIQTVTVQRHLIGGAGLISGSIRSETGSITSVRVGRNVLGGTGLGSGSVSCAGQLTSLSVGGSMLGQILQPIQIAAGGTNGVAAIGSITVGGTMRDSLVLAGYTMDENDGESDSVAGTSGSLGTVAIGGSMERSSLVGGIGNDLGRFANAQDAPIPGVTDSSIGSVVIGGQVIGSTDPARHFGITARKIGSVVVGGRSQSIPPVGGFTTLGISPNVDIHVVS